MMRTSAFALLLVSISLLRPASSGAVPPSRDGTLPAVVQAASRSGRFQCAPDPDFVRARQASHPASLASPQAILRRPLLVPVDFSDQARTYTADTLASVLFKLRSSGAGTGSARDYYRDASLGQLDVQGEVTPWLRAQNPHNYYAQNSYGLASNVDPGKTAAGLVLEAAQALDGTVDFARYDMDGDGFVDAFCVLHSGAGGEIHPSDRSALWSHQSQLVFWGMPAYRTRSPWPGHPGQFISINRYVVIGELSSTGLPGVAEIGPFCHEFGHTLGLPDLYDTSGPPFAGVGNWDLMAGGVYGGDGQHPGSPAMPGAWTRSYLGWVIPEAIQGEGDFQLQPTEDSPRSLRVWSEGLPSQEYLLLENRQKLGWDRYLTGPGLLAWHCDDAVIASGLSTNSVQRIPLFGVRLVEADGLDQLYQGQNRGDAGDPFPGNSRNSRLDGRTRPALLTNSGLDPEVALEGIRQNPDLSLNFHATVSPQRWLPEHPVAGPAGSIFLGGGANASAAAGPGGSVHLCWADDSHGGVHVYHLERRLGLRWAASPTQLDGADLAFNPVVRQDSRGTIMAVWTQDLDGASQLVGRARLGSGEWSPVQVLRETGSFSSPPVLGVDSRGTYYCAWSERAVTQRDQVLFLSYQASRGWDAAPFVVSDDSSSTQPTLTVDAWDRVHVAWVKRNTIYFNLLIHRLYTPVTGWADRSGPLATGKGLHQPVLTPMDSGQAVISWRQTNGNAESVFFRQFVNGAWLLTQGPAVPAVLSQWPFSVVADAKSGRLAYYWQDDLQPYSVISTREISVRSDPWDASPHTVAGSAAASAASPLALLDPGGNTQLFWLQSDGVHQRTHLASTPPPVPPQIIPFQGNSLLGPPGPNPTSGIARVSFRIPENAPANSPGSAAIPAPARPRHVRLSVHDLRGRRVRLLLEGERVPGSYSVSWDGRLPEGEQAPAGVYFLRLELAGAPGESRKLLRLR